MIPILHTLAVVSACWCVVYTIDRVIHYYNPDRYALLYDRLGLHVTFAYCRCYTTRLNRLFRLWSCCSRRLARGWFNIGICTGLVLMVLSVLVLTFSLYQTLFGQSKDKQVLTPIMPGVNVPWNQIAHYIFTLIICGTFHEMGHALAAVTEQVRINGFGLFLMYLYPGAFVDLHPDHLTVVSPLRQLRIYCAGVWHNILLTIVSIIVFYSIPYLSLPFYTTGNGAVIMSVTRDSVLNDKLTVGSLITQIDSCKIYNSIDWEQCTTDIYQHTQRGYCIDVNYLQHHKLHLLNETRQSTDGNIDCCPHDSPNSVCYTVSSNGGVHFYTCLVAREIISDVRCITNDECTAIKSDQVCATPSIGQYQHIVKIEHTGPGDPVLFMGDLRTLHYTLETTDYQSLYPFILPYWLPRLLETLCIYIGSISAALALMNMVPAYALDGQWALGALLEYCMPEHPHRNRIFNSILICGTILLLLNIVLAFWILLHW